MIGGRDNGAARVLILGAFAQNFARSLQPGQSFGELRADADDLEDRRDQERQQSGEGNEIAERHSLWDRGDLVRADVHNHCADHPHQHGGRKAHEGGRGEALQNIVEQALDTLTEDFFLAGFGVVAFDDAHAAQRFRESACDLGIDLGALAENRPDGGEGFHHRKCEDDNDHQGDAG